MLLGGGWLGDVTLWAGSRGKELHKLGRKRPLWAGEEEEETMVSAVVTALSCHEGWVINSSADRVRHDQIRYIPYVSEVCRKKAKPSQTVYDLVEREVNDVAFLYSKENKGHAMIKRQLMAGCIIWEAIRSGRDCGKHALYNWAATKHTC